MLANKYLLHDCEGVFFRKSDPEEDIYMRAQDSPNYYILLSSSKKSEVNTRPQEGAVTRKVRKECVECQYTKEAKVHRVLEYPYPCTPISTSFHSLCANDLQSDGVASREIVAAILGVCLPDDAVLRDSTVRRADREGRRITVDGEDRKTGSSTLSGSGGLQSPCVNLRLIHEPTRWVVLTTAHQT